MKYYLFALLALLSLWLYTSWPHEEEEVEYDRVTHEATIEPDDYLRADATGELFVTCASGCAGASIMCFNGEAWDRCVKEEP